MHLISYCSTTLKVLVGQNIIASLQPAVDKPQIVFWNCFTTNFIYKKTKPQQTSLNVLLSLSNDSKMKAWVYLYIPRDEFAELLYEDFIGLHFQVFQTLRFMTLLKVEICHGVTFMLQKVQNTMEKRSYYTLF